MPLVTGMRIALFKLFVVAKRVISPIDVEAFESIIEILADFIEIVYVPAVRAWKNRYPGFTIWGGIKGVFFSFQLNNGEK